MQNELQSCSLADSNHGRLLTTALCEYHYQAACTVMKVSRGF